MKSKTLLLTLIALGILSSLYVVKQKYEMESRSKNIEIVLDYDDVTGFAALNGITPADAFESFKSGGAVSVALTEGLFGDLVRKNEVSFNGKDTYTFTEADAAETYKQLLIAMPALKNSLTLNGSSVKISGVTSDFVEKLPIGFDRDALNIIKSVGLEPVGRIYNYVGITPAAIDAKLAYVKSCGIRKIIFASDRVFGFKESVADAAESIERYGLIVGKVEFAKQRGEEAMAAKIPGSTIIVHSVSAMEQVPMSKDTLIERYRKAVRERNVKMCYIRTFDTSSGEQLKNNTEYITEIADAIKACGYTIGSAEPFEVMTVKPLFRAVAGLGVVAGALLLLTVVFNLSAGAVFGWFAVLFAFCVFGPYVSFTAQKLAALLAAVVFPILGVVVAAKTEMMESVAKIAARLVLCVLVSVCGGLLVEGLIADRNFVLRVCMFMGVKLAHLIPVLAACCLFVGGIVWNRQTCRDANKTFRDALLKLGRNPVLLWQVGIGVVMLGVVGLMLARSGNDSGLGAGSFELAFRSVLDKVLFVRPRTKEFLVGYPLLMAGMAFLTKGKRNWAVPCIVVGSVGLISALNTFCHIHTPLILSFVRTLNGLWVGLVIGIILSTIVIKVTKE
ncbi:MAG: hypothetical protein J6332_08615 [Abditibacteriota bacterium]|nr:hypothetical protein [Abditibacteriota bacterium]